jgi:hypothetical protein
MKQLRLLCSAALLAVSLPALAQQPAPTEPKVLADGADAKSKRVDNLYQERFIEIFLAARKAKTGCLVASCHNTLFTPAGIPASKDTAPRRWLRDSTLVK